MKFEFDRKVITIAMTALLAGATNAYACTPVTSVPATLSTPGEYCLTGDLSYSSTSGAAITIDANDVTLDFQGHKLSGNYTSSYIYSYGVSADNNGNDHHNVTIRNGHIEGFGSGIGVATNGGDVALIENMLISKTRSVGINATGARATVRNNRIKMKPHLNQSNSTAINVGAYADVVDNQITFDGKTQATYGMQLSANTRIENNVIQMECPTTLGSTYAVCTGIWGFASSGSQVVNNRIIQAYKGLDLHSKAMYRDNAMYVQDATTDGVDFGNNQSSSY